MISQIEITGNKYEVDETTRKYAEKHIGKLDKYLPRHAKKSVTARVVIEQINAANDNKYEVEAILTVPDKTIVAKDQSSNVLAAIDIVEAKLDRQIRRYKTEKNPRLGKAGVMARFKRSLKRG
ncbi:MAG: ribosome-associated translation inhibitor RaiA [bacterium]|nr:ribosome-associated translation inhibitor RaiA [bacterium]